MRIQIIVSQASSSWIIGKIAQRLGEELRRKGHDAALGPDASDDADVNHWMSYAEVSRRAGRVSTFFITHIDDPYKTSQLARILGDRADLGLCMSSDMMRALIDWGLPAERLWWVLPAHDAPRDPRRIRIAITTRLYADGRKREDFLLRLASEADLSPFHFGISGEGWEKVIPSLRRAGAEVEYLTGSADYQADHAAILEMMKGCDYYLYLGMDEGSLGTVDALALGIDPIVTPQGFHLDLGEAIEHWVEKYEEFRDLMFELAVSRGKRLDSVRNWSWENYAEEHVLIWKSLIDGNNDMRKVVGGRDNRSDTKAGRGFHGLSRRTWANHYSRYFSPSRALDGLVQLPWIQWLRQRLGR